MRQKKEEMLSKKKESLTSTNSRVSRDLEIRI
jgi:hypothetical protein